MVKLILLSLFLISSCASMKSGKYVKAFSKDSWSSLSKEFKIPADELKAANANRSIKPGGWIFIPSKIGLFKKPSTARTYASKNEAKSDFMWPVPSSRIVSSYFGPRKRKGRTRNHDGIDVPGKTGVHIVASQEGKVIYSNNKRRGYGNMVIISHKNNLFTTYAHAKKNLVKEGQYVHKGEVIALLGSTGRSTGPHLHFEIRKGSQPVNPLNFIKK